MLPFKKYKSALELLQNDLDRNILGVLLYGLTDKNTRHRRLTIIRGTGDRDKLEYGETRINWRLVKSTSFKQNYILRERK